MYDIDATKEYVYRRGGMVVKERGNGAVSMLAGVSVRASAPAVSISGGSAAADNTR